MVRRVSVSGKVNDLKVRSRSESESEEGEMKSDVLDPKPGDLPMSRLKWR